MRVHFLGGADEVGASALVVETGRGGSRRRVLIDAGVRMGGAARDRLPDLAALGGPADGLDAVLLTHAHLDHSGALPLVHSAFPRTPVYATEPTAALLRVLLLDAIKVMAARADAEGEIPLYPQPAVEALLARTQGVRFLEPLTLGGGELRATFFPAGHVLGAAAVGLETREGSVLVTGDVSVGDQLTVSGMPRPRFTPDLVVCESTYGARLHASRRAEEQRLVEAVLDTLGRGGKVLVPAFALGRAQEVLLLLRKALARDDAPPATVHADGMVRAVTAVYAQYADYLAPALRDRAEQGRGLFYTADGRVRAVAGPQEREAILAGGPCVIVASSGMLAGGPSAQYAARLLPCPEALVAITGYQDEEAPGRRLQDAAAGKAAEIVIDGVAVPVRCRVATVGLSAHADANELAGLVAALRPRAAALVHGDEEARRGLARTLSAHGAFELHLPHGGEAIDFALAAARPGPRVRTGLAGGRPLTAATLPELHRHLRGRFAAGRTFAVAELAEHWYGSAQVPVDLAPAAALVAATPSLFAPDRKRPYLFRLVEPGTTPPPAAAPATAPARLEQNVALARVDALLGPDSGLHRKGAETERGVLRLSFDFPDVARERHADAIARVAVETGWDVALHPEPNLAALMERARAACPAAVGAAAIRKVSVQKDDRSVRLQVTALPDAAAEAAAAARYRADTGYELRFEKVAAPPGGAREYDATGRMEVNQAFARVDRTFVGCDHRPLRRSRREDAEGPFLELGFVSPEVGGRYADLLARLEYETGWRVRVAPRVDQQAVLAAVRELLPADIALAKGPGLDVAARKVVLRLAAPAPPDAWAAFRDALERQTGFEAEAG